MDVNFGFLFDFFVRFFFVLTRISAVIFSMPVFGSQLISPRIKVAFSVALALLVFPNIAFNEKLELMSLHGFFVLACQLLIGISIGLLWHLIFEVFSFCGTIVAMQMGLGFAVMNDPQSNISVPVIGQLYLMILTLLFLSTDVHILIIQMMATSFDAIPLGMQFFQIQMGELFAFTAMIFSGAISLALPSVVSLLIVNLGFGLMSKFSPQLNIFSMGFSITLIFGVIIIYGSLNASLDGFYSLTDRVIEFIESHLIPGLSNV